MSIRCKCDVSQWVNSMLVLMWYSVMWLIWVVPYWTSWLFGRGIIDDLALPLSFNIGCSVVVLVFCFCFVAFLCFWKSQYAKMAANLSLLDLKRKSMPMLFIDLQSQIAEKHSSYWAWAKLNVHHSINLCITILGTNRYYSIIYCLLLLRSSDANKMQTICLL